MAAHGLGSVAEKEDEEEKNPPRMPAALSDLPVCALDCADGALYFEVLCAWCVPWADVPLAPFLAAWFALSEDTRRALLQERTAFVAELHVDHWRAHMLDRDDVAMLAATAAIAAATTPDDQAFCCINRGAIRCLEWWADHWADGGADVL